MNDQSNIKLPAPLTAGFRPRAIVPTDIDQVWRLASVVVASGLTPYALNTKEKASVAIMHGLELGLPPMMSLQRIAVINGRPCLWGEAVPGVALGTNQLEDWIETIEGEGNAMVATCTVKRHGIKTPKTASFSVADAKQADLWDERQKVKRKGRDGTLYDADNDSPWHCYPKRMLQMRARVAFRDLFADVFSGLYIAEELIGNGPIIEGTFQPVENPLGGASPAEQDGSGAASTTSPAARPLPAEEAAPTTEPPALPAEASDDSDAARAPPTQKSVPPAQSGEKKGQRSKGKQEAARQGATNPTPTNGAAAAVAQPTTQTGENATTAADSAWDEKLPEPYVQRKASDYIAYAQRWITTAFKGQHTYDQVRERWNKEVRIRNALGDMLDQDQKNELRALVEAQEKRL